MVKAALHLCLILFLFILGACASKMKDQMRAYREAYAHRDYTLAQKLLKESEIQKEAKNRLLWLLEDGTLSLAMSDLDSAISKFQESLELIDKLYTTKLSSKAASFLVNDASDIFYGAHYERSYAHYFLVKAYYLRYLKSQNKLDLQGARATILAWDTFFTTLQRAATTKTLYHTDLMLKVFGGEIHEVSGIKNDQQIALQLYKDALKILDVEGGIFSLFNSKYVDYIKAYEQAIKDGQPPAKKWYEPTSAYHDLKDFLHFKILALTKDIRGFDYAVQMKSLKPSPAVIKKLAAPKSNVVVIFEEGLIPQKVGKPFNFGIKGAVNAVDNPAAKAFIATVGTEFVTTFAMNKLGMAPSSATGAGSFIFAHDATRLAAQEAAIEFELPMIENVPPLKKYELIITDGTGKTVYQGPFPIISENGDIAKVVLEEDVVSRYVKTGTRIAVKHLVAIVAALQVYRGLHKGNDSDFLAKAAAMATYIGASKGIAALEKADIRQWTTLPQAFRMTELSLSPGHYNVAIQGQDGEKGSKILGSITVKDSDKTIFPLKLSP